MNLRIGDALIDDVLAATPDDALTIAVTRSGAPYSVWRFGLDEIARIGAQHPLGQMGTIESLFPSFLSWLGSASAEDRARYDRQRGVMLAGRLFEHRPILIRRQPAGLQIHDGKHRLFAAWEYRTARPDLTVEVFVGG